MGMSRCEHFTDRLHRLGVVAVRADDGRPRHTPLEVPLAGVIEERRGLLAVGVEEAEIVIDVAHGELLAVKFESVDALVHA